MQAIFSKIKQYINGSGAAIAKHPTEDQAMLLRYDPLMAAEAYAIDELAYNLGVNTRVDDSRVTFSDTGDFIRYPLTFTADVKAITGLAGNIGLRLSELRRKPTPARFIDGTLTLQVPWIGEPRSLQWADAPLDSLNPFSMLLGMNYSADPPAPVVADFTNGVMANALFAGTTGSGKTTAMLGAMTSLCYATSPADVQVIFIQPKRQADFDVMGKLPHVTMITDADESLAAVADVHAELDRRDSYVPRQRVFLVIDEYSRLCGKLGDRETELDDHLVRILEAGRSQGIHAILCTQRPDADTMVGKAKANLNVRVAGRVAGEQDSRIALGRGGIDCRLLPAGRGSFYSILDDGELIQMQTYDISNGALEPAIDMVCAKWGAVEPYTIQMQQPKAGIVRSNNPKFPVTVINVAALKREESELDNLANRYGREFIDAAVEMAKAGPISGGGFSRLRKEMTGSELSGTQAREVREAVKKAIL